MSVIPEVVIKLGTVEVQQALAIDLDRDSEQALRFIAEKIVAKCFKPSCQRPCRRGARP